MLCELYQQDRRRKKLKPMKTGKAKTEYSVPGRHTICFGTQFNDSHSASTVLPPVVVRWAGMKSRTGTFKLGEKPGALTLLNDRGEKFSKIADVIEAEYKNL